MNTSYSQILFRAIIAVIFATVIVGYCQSAVAQRSQPETFASPAQATHALYHALKSNDAGALRSILGAGPELTSSGNESDDELNRHQFVGKYEEMHRLVREPDGTTVLYIGAENWPFPFPLIEKAGRWYFDPDAGSEELRAREIGRNEIVAIGICKQVAIMTKAGVGTARSDDPTQLFAAALATRSTGATGEGEVFDGYYFRVLPNKSKGVQLVAYPAEYRLSGVMTFIVRSDGSVYENDLGVQTANQALQLQAKPGKDWTVVQ